MAQSRTGSLGDQPSELTYFLYSLLTRFPLLYVFVERIRRRGNWDKRVYLSFVRRGDTVLDVGANFGAHTIILSNLVGKKGAVLAFEPVSESFDALRENVRRRGRHRNIDIFRLALGNPAPGQEEAVIRIPGDDFGQAGTLVRDVMSDTDRKNLAANIIGHASDNVQRARIQRLSHCHGRHRVVRR